MTEPCMNDDSSIGFILLGGRATYPFCMSVVLYAYRSFLLLLRACEPEDLPLGAFALFGKRGDGMGFRGVCIHAVVFTCK